MVMVAASQQALCISCVVDRKRPWWRGGVLMQNAKNNEKHAKSGRKLKMREAPLLLLLKYLFCIFINWFTKVVKICIAWNT